MNIIAGSVIFYYQNEIYPPKYKYAVVISPIKKWCCLINTENREHYYCLPILKKDNTFLKYDSFISCSNFFGYDPSKIKRIEGIVSEADRIALQKHLSESKTISKVNKEIILNELNKRL